MEAKKVNIGFFPADILLPKHCNMTKWSVVACDQYTSQPEYWDRVDAFVGDAPSTLRLILPESRLEDGHVEEHIREINHTMSEYLRSGLFESLNSTFVYVERSLSNGSVRHGLVGMLDLNEYDYAPGSTSLVRATEGTVLSRIPPRVAVRKNAPIELPHIMMLIDDAGKSVIEPLAGARDDLRLLYDFDLMEGGGHIAGWQLGDQSVQQVMDAMRRLADPETWAKKYGDDCPMMLLASGDGNHSLATAKETYEQRKKLTPPEQWDSIPARYALVELVNLHDEALQFEPIHRIVTEVDPDALVRALLQYYEGAYEGAGAGHSFTCLASGKQSVLTVPKPRTKLAVGTLQEFLDDYTAQHGGKIDYIHGEAVVAELSSKPGAIGFLLPAMGKEELFPAVMADGVLPRKTFSMGEASDKRFYLECRKIR
jgi:hypothetical protein